MQKYFQNTYSRHKIIVIAILVGIVVILLLRSCADREQSLPNFKDIKNIKARKTAFIEFVLPLEKAANSKVARTRTRLQVLFKKTSTDS